MKKDREEKEGPNASNAMGTVGRLMRNVEADKRISDTLRTHLHLALVNQRPCLKVPTLPGFEVIPQSLDSHQPSLGVFAMIDNLYQIIWEVVFLPQHTSQDIFYSLMNLTHLCNHTVSEIQMLFPPEHLWLRALANICCKHPKAVCWF